MQCACRPSGFLLGILAVPIFLLPGLASAQPALAPTDSLYARAERAAEVGSTDVAIQLYGEILRRDSSETGALYDRADLYTKQNLYAKAAQSLERVQKFDSTPTDYVLGNRAWYLILADKQLDTARKLSRRAMEMDLNSWAWPLNHAHTYLLDKQPRTAKFYYRKAMRRMSGTEDMQRALSDFDMLIAQGRPKEEILKMKDWFHVTYLKEGQDMRGGTGPLALIGTWITVVVGLVSLFQKGGKAMTAESQERVRDWLMRNDRSDHLSSWPDSFKSLFDAVFTEHHFSWTCFYRSVLASAIVVTVTLLGMVAFRVMSLHELDPGGSLLMGSLSSVGAIVVFNSIIDYISLYQTRWVIGKMAEMNSPTAYLGFLGLDAVLTAAIFVYIPGSVQILAVATQGSVDTALWRMFFLELPIFAYDIIKENPPFWAAFVSTFLTSIWIWLYAIAGLTLQGSTSLLGGVEWMRELFDVENRPVQALGLMLAILTTGVFLLSIPFAV